jgi:hypothetical protein
MSNSIAKRTRKDSARSFLYNTIVGARKLVKSTKTAASEAKKTSKQAWNAKI